MEMVPSTTLEQFSAPSSIFRGPTAIENQAASQQNPRVFNNLSNNPPEEISRTHVLTKPTHPGGRSVKHQEEGTLSPQVRRFPKPRHSIQPADKRYGSKPPQGHDSHSGPNRRKYHTPALPHPRKKREHDPPNDPFTPPEDCISRLPAGIPFPKKPDGCKIVPQWIEPRPADRSTIYFTRNGVLGMPLQYMYDLDDMDNGDEPANLGLDPMKSCEIALVIAWPGYKEATYKILVYTPLYPTAPFVTVYGLRQLTKRELATETLRCIHRWMIEHPWSGERHEGVPEWKLSGEKSPGVSAKLVWLSMISPVGDGRWVTQLQKAPGPILRRNP